MQDCHSFADACFYPLHRLSPMSTFLQLALLLSIILLSARLARCPSVRLGHPAVLGELLVGILLGSSAIAVLNLPFIDRALAETIAERGELGVLLLMFIAGLELHLDELTRNTRMAATAACVAWLIPLTAEAKQGIYC